MNFDEIIEQTTLDDIRAVYEGRLHDSDTKKNISFFARVVAKMHPGWEYVPKDLGVENFKKAIENLYNSQKSVKQKLHGDNLLTELFHITATTLKDNHLSIRKSDGTYPCSKQTIEQWENRKLNHPDGVIGKNVAYESNELKNILPLSWQKLSNGMPILIAEDKEMKTGIIAFSSCTCNEMNQNEVKKWKDILTVIKNTMPNWKNVIVDLRQNTGGNGFQIQAVAEMLYGEKVPYCLKAQKSHSKETQIREEFGKYPIQEQELWNWADHPFSEKKRNVYVLIDKQTGSAAEAIIPMLENYPDIHFIGERTCGCCQYGAIRPVPLLCGAQLHMGSIFRSYTDGMIECEGHKPDVICQPNENAYDKAYKLIQKKTQNKQKKAENSL